MSDASMDELADELTEEMYSAHTVVRLREERDEAIRERDTALAQLDRVKVLYRAALAQSKARAQTRQTWYFTFGFGQPNEGRYIKRENCTADEARDWMNLHFNVWGFQYSEAEWFEDGVSQADRYSLRAIA